MCVQRVALITGGAGDLGLATARRLAASGVRVILADLSLGAVEAAVRSLPGEGHQALAVDVTDEARVTATFGTIEQDVGPIAILGQFAGIVDGAGPLNGILLADLEADVWRKVFDVNVFGTFLCVREMVRRRRAIPVEHGRIVTFSSIAGQMGGYLAGAAYAASKSAIIGFSKNIAREVAPLGMTVNIVSPGAIDSKMNREAAGLSRDSDANSTAAGALGGGSIPLGRKGSADEVAALAAFLMSPEAAYITGQTMAINGGSYM
jgi:3-oxoacyl-[acyl-carrier protein] reductase